MRIIFLSTELTVLADIFIWLVLHLGVSFTLTKMRHTLFNPKSFVFRARDWERSGKFYEKFFRVKSWKAWIPDAAAWFKGGFPKKRLASATAEYMDRFIHETCRGEAAHWIVFAASPLFFLWNPAWVGMAMVVYGVASNFPCVIVQRYNRFRFLRIQGALS